MHWWNYLIIIVCFLVGCFGVWWNNHIQKAELRTVEANSKAEGFDAGYRRGYYYRSTVVNSPVNTDLVNEELERWLNESQ